MVHVQSYSRIVNGRTVQVVSYDRADPPAGAETQQLADASAATASPEVSYNKLKATGKAAEYDYIGILPDDRKSDITDHKDRYDKAVAAINNATFLSETEKHLYKLFYVWEGGMIENSQGTVAGIAPRTLRWIVRGDSDLPRLSAPREMTEAQLPTIYRDALDEYLRTAGGAAALSKIPDMDVAAFVGDTAMREGGPQAAKDITFALNDALGALDQWGLPLDFKVKPDTMDAIAKVISSTKGKSAFCKSLEKYRNLRYHDGGDISRTAYFVGACR